VKTAAAGALEAERLIIVIQKIRQLRTQKTASSRSKRSAVLSTFIHKYGDV
jgi:hypothetical protein